MRVRYFCTQWLPTVVPAALAYPEVIPSEHHEATLYGPGGLTTRLRSVIEAVAHGRSPAAGLRRSMARSRSGWFG